MLHLRSRLRAAPERKRAVTRYATPEAKATHAVEQLRYRLRHPERVLATKKKYYSNPENVAAHHQRNRDWRRKNHKWVLAHQAVYRAVKKGRLIRPKNCETCGQETMLHAHHEDYSEPLAVIWLCAGCHRKRHGVLEREKGRGRERTRIIHLIQEKCRPIISPVRKVGEMIAMTIGVGYLGLDWIVLGSDMELTGSAKYAGVKDYYKWFAGQKGVIASIYSGREDDMRCVWEELGNRIEVKEKGGLTLEQKDVRIILSESLDAVPIDRKSQFQMLVAITKQEKEPMFLRVLHKRVSPATSWEIIGRGDCELSRYLTSWMKTDLTQYQAVLWSTHLVNTAKSFVQYVGQGIRISVIKGGTVAYMDGDIFSQKLAMMDAYIGGLWRDFCNLELSQQEYEMRLQAFTIGACGARGGIPKLKLEWL
jgi:hypothetical protein